MPKKRRFRTYEIEQHSQSSFSHGSPNCTQSCGASQPTQPHGSSQPHHLHKTSQPSNSHNSLQHHEEEEQLNDVNDQFQVNAQPMDKTWMTKSRSSREFLQGVLGFLRFASYNTSKEGKILCPCVQCANSFMLNLDVVHDHLLSFGICQGYNHWYYHGETISAPPSSKTCGFGPIPKSSGSTCNGSSRFNVVNEEEVRRDKETISKLKDTVQVQQVEISKLEDTVQVQQVEISKLEEKGQSRQAEISTLKEQVAFLMRHTGVQVRDICNGSTGQASPQTNQRSSHASHDIECFDRGNRSV